VSAQSLVQAVSRRRRRARARAGVQWNTAALSQYRPAESMNGHDLGASANGERKPRGGTSYGSASATAASTRVLPGRARSNLLPAKPLQQKIRIPVRMVHLTARGLRWRLEAQTLKGVADGRGARAQARRPAARR